MKFDRSAFLKGIFQKLVKERTLNVDALLAIPESDIAFEAQLLKKFSELCPHTWYELTERNEKSIDPLFSVLGIQVYSHEARDFMIVCLRELGILEVKHPPNGNSLFIRLSPQIMPYLTRRILSLAPR